MSLLSILFLGLVVLAVFTVRREHAPVVLLLGCIYIPMSELIEVGPATLHFYRLVLIAGVARVIIKGERLDGPATKVDKAFWILLMWLLVSSIFHEEGALNRRAGQVLSIGSSYFLARCWCRDEDGVRTVIAALGVLMIPLAIEMLQEQITRRNLFGSVFTGISEAATIREGRVRSQGPFRHAILAGSVGAACFPLMFAIRRDRPIIAVFGGMACIGVAWSSGSSGPVVSLLASGLAVLAWRFRHISRKVVWVAIVGYLLLEVVSTRPAYTAIVTRLGVMNGSTAHYRSLLITTTIDHIDEWWMVGTDYTKHWIPSGIGSIIEGKHIDVTNYYVAFAISGGALAVGLLLWLLVCLARSFLRQMVDSMESVEGSKSLYLLWCVGCCVFGLALSGSSVSYFDQSMVVFWVSVGMMNSLVSRRELAASEERGVDSVDALPETPVFAGEISDHRLGCRYRVL